MIERIRYRFMAHDPAVDLPIGYRKQAFELLELQAIETLKMLIGEGGEDEVKLAESAALGTKQRLLPAHFDVHNLRHGVAITCEGTLGQCEIGSLVPSKGGASTSRRGMVG